jgi:hypothetical protein
VVNGLRSRLIRLDLLDGLAHRIHVFLQCGGPAGRKPEADEATSIGIPAAGNPWETHPIAEARIHTFEPSIRVNSANWSRPASFRTSSTDSLTAIRFAKMPSTCVAGAFGLVDSIWADVGKRICGEKRNASAFTLNSLTGGSEVTAVMRLASKKTGVPEVGVSYAKGDPAKAGAERSDARDKATAAKSLNMVWSSKSSSAGSRRKST